MYEPYEQPPSAVMGLALRTDVGPEELTAVVRRTVTALDADLPIFDVRTMEAAFARSRLPA